MQIDGVLSRAVFRNLKQSRKEIVTEDISAFRKQLLDAGVKRISEIYFDSADWLYFYYEKSNDEVVKVVARKNSSAFASVIQYACL